MSLVRLNVKGISYSQTQNEAYALILSEVNGNRKLPIIIGSFEAQSIAIALEKGIQPPRPLTHDLFKNFADRFDIIIKQVIIHKLVDGIFYSSIISERDKIEEIIDARTSDAIALAVRFSAPIFTYKTILDNAGIFLRFSSQEQNSSDDTTSPSSLDDVEAEVVQDIRSSKKKDDVFKNHSLEELKQLLEKAVQDEDYEKAATIRDEIHRRD